MSIRIEREEKEFVLLRSSFIDDLVRGGMDEWMDSHSLCVHVFEVTMLKCVHSICDTTIIKRARPDSCGMAT